MVSSEDVLAAYRLILGREPESAAAVQSHMHAANIQELRKRFLESEEFRQALMAASGISVGTSFHYAPPIDVEVTADEETLNRLLDKVERCWTRLGQTDPYWSVISTDRFAIQNFEKHAEEFYTSGKYDVNYLIAYMERNGVAWSRLASCLEFGCGTGRVTPWLARRFQRVIACDISLSHLQLAKARAQKEGISNVDFRHTSRLKDLASFPLVDLVYSVIVLQHNPPPVIYVALGSLFQRLNPGGVAFFQVPTYASGYSFKVQKFLSEPENASFEMHLLPQRFVYEVAAANRCVPLEVEPDDKSGTAGWVSNTFLFRKLN